MSSHSDNDRKLDEMDSLSDVGRLPGFMYSGAVVNVLATVWAIFRFGSGREGNFPGLVRLVSGVIALNLAPVFILRRTTDMEKESSRISEADFFGDQHRFPRWVYVAASANMALWVSVAWLVSKKSRRGLPATLAVSGLVTLLPKFLAALEDRRRK